MELLLSGKHCDFDDEQKQLAQTLADKLAQSYPSCKLSSLRVNCSTERNFFLADASINGKNLTLNASSKADDLKIAISAVFEKLDKQLRRYLERLQELSTKPDEKMKQKIWTSDDLQG